MSLQMSRKAFLSLGPCAATSIVLGSIAAGSTKAEAAENVPESSQAVPLEDLSSQPSLEEFQDFADQELYDMPDPEGMLADPDNAS